ncbi:MAG: penicillin-binding protein activator LpoB [Elusimicrobia bacterium]|nr:penicillin-binding protein activator LpoB [Elusimicrobiota bacterium]
MIFSLSLAGCASTPTVKRLSPADAIDLSGRWNDEDSRLVSEELIQQSLSSGWAEKYRRDRGRLPAVIVGRVKNMTYEHINSETFMKDIERALLNSGLINFVASSAERDEIRSEREDMQTWASIDTRSSLGRESGADYMIRGIISSIYDEEAGKRVVYYQIDLSLIDLEDNIIIWAGQKSIKKLIKRPLFSF